MSKESIFSKIKNYFGNKSVNSALKNLANYQINGNYTEKELKKICNTIKSYPELIDKKGYGYLKDFANYYVSHDNLGTMQKLSKLIAECISENAKETNKDPAAVMNEVATKIAGSNYQSLTKESANFGYTLTTNIEVSINTGASAGTGKRAIEGTKANLKHAGIIEEKIEEAIKAMSQHPALYGIMGVGQDIKVIQNDMITAIGHGSAGTFTGAYAKNYIEQQQFASETKRDIINLIKEDKLETPEGQKIMAQASIKAVTLLKNDYEIGMTRGKSTEIVAKQLATINEAIEKSQNVINNLNIPKSPPPSIKKGAANIGQNLSDNYKSTTNVNYPVKNNKSINKSSISKVS